MQRHAAIKQTTPHDHPNTLPVQTDTGAQSAPVKLEVKVRKVVSFVS